MRHAPAHGGAIPARPAEVCSPPRARPAEVWSPTRAALVLGGPDPGVPHAGRPVVGEVLDPVGPTPLWALTTPGTFAGDICRCPGSPTVSLPGADGAFTGVGSPHGSRDMSWERSRFRKQPPGGRPGRPARPAGPVPHPAAPNSRPALRTLRG